MASAAATNTPMPLPPHYALPKLISLVVLVIRGIKHHFIFHQGLMLDPQDARGDAQEPLGHVHETGMKTVCGERVKNVRECVV